MKQKTYDFAYRSIETADIKRRGLVTTMRNLRSTFRPSRSYGSMKSYYIRNH